MVFVNLMVGLTITCALHNVLTYLYGRQCPWTLDLEKVFNLIGAARSLLDTITQAFIVLMTLGVAYGYEILYADISVRILKFVFGLTITKFFFIQIEKAFSGNEILQVFAIIFKFLFTILMLALVGGYCYLNISFLEGVKLNIQRQARSYGENNPAVLIVQQQMTYRRRLYIACAIFSIGYYVVQIVLICF